MAALSIGQLARQSGIGIETIRFYEREGVLAAPGRKPSGYREYDQEAIRVLRFVRRAKQLGFTLKEIKVLLGLRLDTSASRADVRAQATAKLAEIDAKIQDLQRMRKSLAKLVRTCHGDGAAPGCPILTSLDAHESS
jgi:MerR family transcriptional regulator, copper efflux regulator